MFTGFGEHLGVVGHSAEEVGVLHNDGCSGVVNGSHERVKAAHALFLFHGLEFKIKTGNVGSQHDPPDGVDGFVHHQHAAAGGANSHHGRFKNGGTAVIDRGIGAVHAHEATYGSLKLKNSLKSAL